MRKTRVKAMGQVAGRAIVTAPLKIVIGIIEFIQALAQALSASSDYTPEPTYKPQPIKQIKKAVDIQENKNLMKSLTLSEQLNGMSKANVEKLDEIEQKRVEHPNVMKPNYNI